MTFDLPKFASFCRTERFGRSKVNIGRSKVNIGRSKVNIGRSKVTTPPNSSTSHEPRPFGDRPIGELDLELLEYQGLGIVLCQISNLLQASQDATNIC